jgi:tetratricopeptide (TPR) repeat protein
MIEWLVNKKAGCRIAGWGTPALHMPDMTTRTGTLDTMTVPRAGSFGLLLLLAYTLSGCGAFISPQHRIETARGDISSGKWGAAAIELRMVVQSHPDNAQAWQLLAELSLDAADLNGAQSSLKHAIAAGAKGPDLDALRVRIWLAADQPKTVIEAITQHSVQLAEPGQSVALARAYAALGQAPKAVQTLQPVLARQPDLTEARVVLAEALAAEGQVDPALQQLDTATQYDSTSPRPPLARGRILAWRGQYAPAESALVLALRHMSPAQPFLDRIEALIPLTEVRLAQGEIDAAQQSQAALAKLTPGAPAAELLGARIKLARGELSEATYDLQAIVAKAPGYLPAQMYLGAAQLARGNLDQAQQALEQVLQKEPDNAEARKLLATAQLRLGAPQAALSALTPLLSEQAADTQLLALFGAAENRAGTGESVVQALQGSLRADPDNQTLKLNLAQAYLGAGRAQDALTLLQTTPDSGDVRRDSLLVAALLGARGPAAAEAQVNQMLTAHPADPAVLKLGAAYFFSQRDFGQASKLLQSADRARPDPAVKLALARVDLAQGKVKQAQVVLDQAVALQPAQPALVESAGLLLLAANQYDAALARLVQATKLAPDNALYCLNTARAQVALSQSEAARESLQRASQLRPGWLPPVGMLTIMDVAAGKGQAALQRVNALLASEPHDAGALALKGLVESSLGDTNAAFDAYTQAQQQRPTALVAVRLYQLGLASHRTHPEKPLQQWLTRQPNDWQVHEVLGEYYLTVPSLRPAAREFEAALRASPQNLTALNNLAWTYGKLGDPRAESLAERAYQLGPQSPDVNDTLGWVLVRKRKWDRALTVLGQAVKLQPANPEFEYHYAYALFNAGKRDEARQILTRLLATPQPFDSRADAQRLLAAMKAT